MFRFNQFALRIVPAAASVIGLCYVVDTLKLNRSSVKPDKSWNTHSLNTQLWSSQIIPYTLITFNAGLSFDTKVWV